MSDEPDTILTLHGTQESSCGYCGPPGGRSVTSSSVSIGATPMQLSCSVYQKMVDRGWRRSGQYIYKPTMMQTCCPQYPIRLDALAFEPTRSHRKALYRFNRLIIDGDDAAGESEEFTSGDVNRKVEGGTNDHKGKESTSKGKVKPKPRKQVFSLIDAIHESEAAFRVNDAPPSRHKFEIILEAATFTQEKFELYKDYQFHVHKETEEKKPHSFKRFLCDTDLPLTPIAYSGTPGIGLPTHYGAHHQLYRIDGELVAMSVLDILPACVSGVYFMYTNKWEKCQLGKLSVLREAALAREMYTAGLPQLKWVYLGFYVHSCQKMRYKGDYSPSYLLDPETYEWFPMKDCTPLLDKYRYACFSNPSHSLTPVKKPPVPEIPQKDLRNVFIVDNQGGKLIARPIAEMGARYWGWYKNYLLETIDGLGMSLSKEVFLSLG